MLPWIRSAALHTTAAVGPSGLDALGWRRLCTSFKSASLEPCHFLALVTKCLCTELVDAATITPLMASHLIALSKNPGVHPIGIGDTARHIIAKAILNITRQDVQEAAGSIQLCAGQISGIEATVHVTTLTSCCPSRTLLLTHYALSITGWMVLCGLFILRLACVVIQHLFWR